MSSGVQLGHGWLVCSVLLLLLVWSKLKMIMSLGRFFYLRLPEAVLSRHLILSCPLQIWIIL